MAVLIYQTNSRNIILPMAVMCGIHTFDRSSLNSLVKLSSSLLVIFLKTDTITSWLFPDKIGVLFTSSESALFVLFLSTARGAYFDGTIKANLEYPLGLSNNLINKKLPLTVLPFLNIWSISFLLVNLFFLGKATSKNLKLNSQTCSALSPSSC